MTLSAAKRYLHRVRVKYLIIRSLECVLLGGITLCLARIALNLLPIGPSLNLIAAFGLAIITSWLWAVRLRLFALDAHAIAGFLNRTYPELKQSVDLLLLDDVELSALQQIQQQKAATALIELKSRLRLPHLATHFAVTLTIFVISTIGFTTLIHWSSQKVDSPPDGKPVPSVPEIVHASLTSIDVNLIPPTYTGLATTEQHHLAIQAPEETISHWSLTFNAPIRWVALIFPGGDTTVLQNRGRSYEGSRKLTTPTFYQIAWIHSDSSRHLSDYYEVDVIKDLPPRIVVDTPGQFTSLSRDDEAKVQVLAQIHDDYGINDAYIVATVSKGNGESVKFREEKIAFSHPSRWRGKSVNAAVNIDLTELGMTPGDELYFFIASLDNRLPASNRARTETFFVSLQDTAKIETVSDAGDGIDLMPAYFRSQRQIIIDTEKLLRDKRKLAKADFNSKSNELGYDQKVLRLRYSEFLGEEFESGIGPQPAGEHEGGGNSGETSRDLTQQYGHVHDRDNEHNLTVEPQPDEHPHDHGADQTDPAKAYMHVHDSEEEATFFTQSIRAKLKAAVTIMWDAELYLRLFEPERSLPFQYQALKLLKEISQDSRVYVHRTGFDAPPVKEDRRLTGELSEVSRASQSRSQPTTRVLPEISLALKLAEEILVMKSFTLDVRQKEVFTAAGIELGALAIENPTTYLEGLSILNRLVQQDVPSNEMESTLVKLRSVLWKALPTAVPTPSTQERSLHILDEGFLDHLNSLQVE